MITMNDRQLQDLQEAVDWQVGERLPDGRILGAPDKRGAMLEGEDHRVAALEERLEPRNKTILELGCGEGYHTVRLAGICKHVTGIEARPKNIACALIRLFVHDIENAKILLRDVRDLDASVGKFDIVFHSGVLYHLYNPVEHLFRVRELADDLLLDTCYCTDDCGFQRSDIHYQGKCYKAFVYPEGGWSDVWSGLEPTSRWLHRDALIELLQDAGYDFVHLVDAYLDKSHNRMTVLARRMRGQTDANRDALLAISKEGLVAKLKLLERDFVTSHTGVARSKPPKGLKQAGMWRMRKLLIHPLRLVKKALRR